MCALDERPVVQLASGGVLYACKSCSRPRLRLSRSIPSVSPSSSSFSPFRSYAHHQPVVRYPFSPPRQPTPHSSLRTTPAGLSMTSRESPYPPYPLQAGYVAPAEPYVEPKQPYHMQPTPQYAPPPQPPQQYHQQGAPQQEQHYQQQQQWAPQPGNAAGGWPQQQFSGDYGSKVDRKSVV